MSDNPEKIAELQNDKLVEILRTKNLGVPVCRHIESKGHNGQQFVKPEYVIETFPSVEFLRSIKLLKMQIRSLVSVRKELHVETSTVPYLEINSNSNNNASAAAASSSSSSSKTATSLTAEEAEKLLQEAAPLFSGGKYSEAVELYSKVIDNISLNQADDASLKTILSRALSNRSGSFLKLKKSQEALEDARRCVDVRPSWIRAHLRVAAAAEELKEFDLAISAYEAAIKAADRSGNVPSQKELESDILRVQRKQFESLMKKIRGTAVSPVFVGAPVISLTSARDTASFRDILISSVKYCTADESAFSFCGTIANFVEITQNQILFGTAAVRDALLTVSKYCADSETAKSFYRSIADLTVNNEANIVLFGTASVRDAILGVSKYCATSQSAGLFCRSIADLILNNEANTVLFGSVSIRDAILVVTKYCTTPDSAHFFCRSVFNLTVENEANKILFGTASVRDALLAVSKYCTVADSACSFCNSIRCLTLNDNNKIVFGTVSVRDALLIVSKYCTTSDSAHSFCLAIFFIVANENNKILFGTVSVRDALVAASKYCTTADSAGIFCGAILSIIYQNESNKSLFATEAIRVATLSVSAYINVYYGVCCCCHVISLLHETNPTLFCVKQTVKSLVKLSKIEMKKQSAESIYWFLSVLLALLHSDKKLFNTTEIRNAVERFEEIVNDPEEVKKLEKKTTALDKLSIEEYLGKARQFCIEFQKVVGGKSGASSASAAAAAAACVE